MRTFVGDDRQSALDHLVNAFDEVASTGVPRVISLESSVGLGKTRLVQELFKRLAATRQGPVAYWPSALDWIGHRADDVLQTRKQVEPTPGWVIPGGVEIPWLWWAIPCHLTNAGSPMRALKDASDQLRVHMDPVLHKVERSERNKEDAIEVLSGMFDLVGVVNPGAVIDAGSKFFNVFQRRRKASQQGSAISMDRRVEAYGESYVEAGRITEGLRAVARARTPVVLVVDDAQWADPGLVSMLRQIVALDDAPILVITTAWPEQLTAQAGHGPETFAGWLASTESTRGDRLERLSIDRMDDASLGQIVLDVAPRTDAATVEQLATLASGSPLVLNLLLDLDVVRRDVKEDGRIDTDPRTLQRLPSSLRGIYMGLWEQLPDPEHSVLALAAVQGPEFLPGFIPEAAIALGRYDELTPAFAAVRDRYGWIRAVNDDRYEFAERQRFDVADDVLREIFDDRQLDIIRRAILAHILALKADERWPDLDLRTRRVALESHLELNEQLGEDASRDPLAIADTQDQLAALDLDAGNPTRAAQLIEASGELRAAAGEIVPAARAEAIAELVEEVTATNEVAAAAVALTAAAAGATGDELGRAPWVVWEGGPVPPLSEVPPSEMGALIEAVVAVEGPVYAGMVYRRLVAASGEKRQGRLIRAALDSGVRSAVRRGRVVASVPDAGGASEHRLLRLPTQPEVRLRQMGERTIEEVPPGELAALAHNVLAREPVLSRDELKRRMLPLLGWSVLNKRVDQALERALPELMGSGAAPAAVAGAAADEWGRLPWTGWEAHELPALADLAPRDVAPFIVEVTAAEGPVTIGRLFELLRQASNGRMTKGLRDSLEGGLAAAVRKGSVVVVAGRRGEPDSRVAKLASQPEVILRTPGDRDTWSIPGSEIADLAGRIHAAKPDLDRKELKRAVGEALGWGRYTAALDKLLESLVPRS